MRFAGGAFSFTSTNGYQFAITDVPVGVGDSVGFKGFVTPGGPFNIGTITISGALQTAPVTGTGTLHITDAVATDLTGSITWIDISTIGVGGIIDLTGVVNLTGITYPAHAGSSSDLNALAAAGSASDVVTFQFVPSQTLTQLKASNGTDTSYSGSITAVPEPSTMIMVGLGMVGMLALRHRHK